jgi:hypothetical protein
LADKYKYNDVMSRLTVTPEMRERILKTIGETDFSQNASDRADSPKRRVIRLSTWMKVIPAAVAILIAAVAVNLWPLTSHNSQWTVTDQETEAAAAADNGLASDNLRSAARTANQENASDEASGIEEAAVLSAYSVETFSSAEEISERLGFSVDDLTGLPFTADASRTEYTVIAGYLAEIRYYGTDGEEAVYRAAEGEENVSGDYTNYAETAQIEADSRETLQDGETSSSEACTVTLKGSEKDSYTLAEWTDGGYSYSLSLSEGISAEKWKTLLEK